jgi:hypothetical protein
MATKSFLDKYSNLGADDLLNLAQPPSGPPINWDRSTLEHGGRLLYPWQRVMEVPVQALDRAFKATNPISYLGTPKQSVVDYGRSGRPMSLPEILVEDGMLGFYNGRNRAAVARLWRHDDAGCGPCGQ